MVSYKFTNEPVRVFLKLPKSYFGKFEKFDWLLMCLLFFCIEI